MFKKPSEFIIDQWEDTDGNNIITYYRLVLCNDEKIHLLWKPTPDNP